MVSSITKSLQITEQDAEELGRRGISVDTLEQQLAIFQKGIPFTCVVKPCTVNDGLTLLSSSDRPSLEQTFDKARLQGRVTKFVPASGAATRMFKSLLASCSSSESPESAAPLSSADQAVVRKFLDNLTQFAFHEELQAIVNRTGQDLGEELTQEDHGLVLRSVLHHPGLNYAQLPKGLLKFHRYSSHSRTPIQEHLVEGSIYAKDQQKQVRIHFTISPEHRSAVQDHLDHSTTDLHALDSHWHLTCSEQLLSTDTLAVDLNNQAFRNREGKLLFRPAGHGALLNNLNALRADIAFIKNIDNVLPDTKTEESHLYKRLLGGLLVTMEESIFESLRQLHEPKVSTQQVNIIADWAHTTLGLTLPDPWRSWTQQERSQFLFSYLNRPLRVCGMVKNTGDPGGGPFWVKHHDGSVSLQIVESSQIDPNDPEQQAIFQSSTHFNPVDMVCGLRDYQGRSFDLHHFVDPDTGFISKKSHEGRELKALELPGLWNGGMAKWNTVFVEVPRSTFNP
ncbi:MAG: DUF4301 family protein, partial [Nitrospirota bacterium]|nr:DUF4301 family protein [Nitrospirota bacterium]